MSRYIVTVKEIWGQQVTIEADSPTEAIEKVAEGDGDYADALGPGLVGPSGFEYILTMGTETWDVEDEAGNLLL